MSATKPRSPAEALRAPACKHPTRREIRNGADEVIALVCSSCAETLEAICPYCRRSFDRGPGSAHVTECQRRRVQALRFDDELARQATSGRA